MRPRVILAVCFFLVASIAALVGLYAVSDAAAIDDSDLRVTFEEIPRGCQNGYAIYFDMVDQFRLPPALGRVIPGDWQTPAWLRTNGLPEHLPEFTALLEKNEWLLCELETSLAQTAFNHRAGDPPWNDTPSLLNMRYVYCYFNVCAARLHVEGQHWRALSLLADALELSSRVRRRANNLITYMMANTGNGISRMGFEAWAAERTSADELRIALAILAQHIPDPQGMRTVWHGEYSATKYFVTEARDSGSTNRYWLKPNETLNQAGELTRSIMRIAQSSSCFDEFRHAVRKIEGFPTEATDDGLLTLALAEPGGWWTWNRDGNVLLAFSFLAGHMETVYELKQHHLQTMLRIAMHAYRCEYGAYPTTIGQLVPGYFSAVPTDPMNGKPMVLPAPGLAPYL